MILDILILLIFCICTVRGRTAGFLRSLGRLAGWALGIILGVLYAEEFSSIIKMTPFDDFMRDRLMERFKDETVDLAMLFPEFLHDRLKEIGMEGLRTTVNHFTDFTMTLLAFGIIIGVTVFLFSRIFRRKGRPRTLIGAADAAAGILCGALKGVILILLLLALLLPVTGFFAPSCLTAVNEQLNHSLLAGLIYDHNPLIFFVSKLPI